MPSLAKLSDLLEAGVRSRLASALAAVVLREGELHFQSFHGTPEPASGIRDQAHSDNEALRLESASEPGGRGGSEAANSITRSETGPASPTFRNVDADVVRAETQFDLASLTKVLSTTALAMQLHARGELDLQRPLGQWGLTQAAFASPALATRTVEDLLTHRSGLPAWIPAWERARADPRAAALFASLEKQPQGAARARAVEVAHRLTLQAFLDCSPERPAGEAAVYSDVGFVLLGALLEEITELRLAKLFQAEVAGPLGLSTLRFVDEAAPEPRPAPVAVTRRAPSRGDAFLRGQVDDDNAYALAGVAGHAGLFGTAQQVAALGLAVLEAWQGSDSGLFAPQSVARFLRLDSTPGSTRCLGWDTPSPVRSAAGRFLRPGEAVGHLGYTGCSLWLDRRRELVIALLTNRVAESEAPEGIRKLRAQFHDTLIEGLS